MAHRPPALLRDFFRRTMYTTAFLALMLRMKRDGRLASLVQEWRDNPTAELARLVWALRQYRLFYSHYGFPIRMTKMPSRPFVRFMHDFWLKYDAIFEGVLI